MKATIIVGILMLLILTSGCTELNIENTNTLEYTEELIVELQTEYAQLNEDHSNYLKECNMLSGELYDELNLAIETYINEYTYIEDLNVTIFYNFSEEEKKEVDLEFEEWIIELQDKQNSLTSYIESCQYEELEEDIKYFEWFFDYDDGPMLSTYVGTNIDPFSYSTRAFVVPTGSLEYGYDVEQSLLLDRCSTMGSLGYTTDTKRHSIEFCVHIKSFIDKGWSGKKLDLYAFDSYHASIFGGINSIEDIEQYHQPEEYQKIIIKVPEIDENWTVSYGYIDLLHCDGEEDCNNFIESISLELEEQRNKFDPEEIEWNSCKHMVETVRRGGECQRAYGEFEGMYCSELIHMEEDTEYYEGTCCEWYKEKKPDSILIKTYDCP